MGQENGAPTTSHDERRKQRIHVVYARQVREKQVFMQELKEYRKKKEKSIYQSIVQAVGPRWYQALSVPQRMALDLLQDAVRQDELEGRPSKTSKILKTLGLFPRPSSKKLMACIQLSDNDAMIFLSQLYQRIFDYTIDIKRESYGINARFILSSILYLGMNSLISLLREQFQPDDYTEKPQPPIVKHKSQVPLVKYGVYLQKLDAYFYEKPVYKRPPPPPLPNLDDLNEPYEDIPVLKRPPPPPPPPPPPKKRIPREVCDKLAGFKPLILNTGPDLESVLKKPTKAPKAKRRSKSVNEKGKKVYGLGLSSGKTEKARVIRKPVAPSTGIENIQYTINGIHVINGRAVFVLGSISILPSKGEIIHGGHAFIMDQYVNINCGVRLNAPPPKSDPCDCVKKWQETVFKYVKGAKCYCGHHYDYGNEGTFPPEELPFFLKPTRHTEMQFNYETIYNLDGKALHVQKEFKKIWETESLLQAGNVVVKEDKKKKKKEKTSNTCLGANPGPEEYLRCALRRMKCINIAARLPDLHLVPELKEWMRRRLYGPLNKEEKAQLLRKSTTYWTILESTGRRFGHKQVPQEKKYLGLNNWMMKQKLNNHFRGFVKNYKELMYRSQAKTTNLYWRSMFHAEVPDKKFRQIYFSYLFNTIDELQMIPYVPRDSADRATRMRKRRYVCLPHGVEDLDAS